jgi:hypothetical protein
MSGIDTRALVAYGIGGYAAQALRTSEFGRPSFKGFALGAITDIGTQRVFGAYVDKQPAEVQAAYSIGISAVSWWLMDKLLTPMPEKQISLQTSLLDSIVSQQVGDLLLGTVATEAKIVLP